MDVPRVEALVDTATILDVRSFLHGLRSISLRNMSMRTCRSGKFGSERDLSSVTSSNLPNLRAVLVLNDEAGEQDQKPDDAEAGGAKGDPAPKTLVSTGALLPTVNPTWVVPETSWLSAIAHEDVLERSQSLVLKVFAVDANEKVGFGPTTSICGLETDDAGQLVWSTIVNTVSMRPFPAGTKLSHLSSLPADCLLVEMSNGFLYAREQVIHALQTNSALPVATNGSWGKGGGDTWRGESDEDGEDEQQPLQEVLQQVFKLEAAAERSRAELMASLENVAAQDRDSFEAARNGCTIANLEREHSAQQRLLETEEDLLGREKRHLEEEALAVEELVREVAAATDAAELAARGLEADKRETLKSHVLLEARRARLTAELQAIYPIKYQEKLGAYTIRGLELPADLYSVDDEKVSSALGYTAHLVCMLAKYLQVPLRYQLIYNASRSAVRDNVTGAGVAYPLFRRGVEKERFDRGVYLLGRDVEQMLISRGVPVKRGGGQLLRNLERLMVIEGV